MFSPHGGFSAKKERKNDARNQKPNKRCQKPKIEKVTSTAKLG